MTLKSRLAALESRFAGPGNIVLGMPDGTERVITLGRRENLLHVFRRVLETPHSDEAGLIRDAVWTREPGGGHLLELAAAGVVARARAPEETAPEEQEELS
jgi:hypothetical protein